MKLNRQKSREEYKQASICSLMNLNMESNSKLKTKSKKVVEDFSQQRFSLFYADDIVTKACNSKSRGFINSNT